MDVKFLILKCFSLLILYLNTVVVGDAPYGLCADPTCTVPVSKGVTILHYSSPDDSRISVEPNEKVEIFVKDYGPKKDLLGVIIKGNKGYISKQFIKEMKALKKDLVPATVDFKTSLLDASHLDVSSHHQQPDKLVHTHTVQQKVINHMPTGIQSQVNKLNENLESPHLSPEFNPSHDMHLDPHSLYDNPDLSSHFSLDHHILSPSHAVDVNSENISPTQFSELNTKLNSFHEYETQNDLNKAPNILPQNHFQVSHNENFQTDSIVSSQDFQSFSQQPPNILQHNFQHPPNRHQQNIQLPSSMHLQNSQLPSSIHQPLPSQKNFQPLPSVKQHFEQPSSMQQQFHSSPLQQMQSYSPDYDFDPMQEAEYAMTMALIQKNQLEDTIHVNSPPQSDDFFQSSQNSNPQFESKLTEFDSVPSQSYELPIQSNDASFYSSSNINPSLTQKSQIPHSEVSEGINDDIQILPKEQLTNIEKTDEIDDPDSETLMNELNAEIDDDDAEIDEDDNEDEYTAILNSESKENIKTDEPIIESSIVSPKVAEEASESEYSQSSAPDSSSFSDIIKEQDVTFSKQENTFSSKEFPLSFEQNQTESMSLEETNVPDIKTQTIVLESFTDRSGEININATSSVGNPSDIVVDPTIVDLKAMHTKVLQEKKIETTKNNFIETEIISKVPDRNNNGALQEESGVFQESSPKINEFFAENEQTSDLNKFISTLDVDGVDDLKNTYQVRNLKGESVTTEETQSDTDSGQDENITQSDTDIYSSFENGWDALKTAIDSFMSWIPEPLYSAIINLQKKGISPRVPVFTVICGFTLIFLIVPLIYIKEYSKEAKLSAQLANAEKDAYSFSATNALLEEKLETLQSERNSLQTSLEEEKSYFEKLKSEFVKQEEELENTKTELDGCMDEYESLREKENEYLSILSKREKEKDDLVEEKKSFEKIIKDHRESIANLTDQLLESERNIEDLEKEKMQYEKLKEDFEEKLSQFERNCNQLLQEAEVWNLRVNELTAKVSEERTLKDEIEAASKEKDEEIESLKQLVETFKSFEEMENTEEQEKSKAEKLQTLMNSALISTQLKKQEDETKILTELLDKEKNKILDMEVELLEAKSEIDKLKLSYNQALQDKAEAQTKLDVLTNYFKDKEIQLQKQLGAQEAVRQKKEEDASSAERRIVLIEQENASYKYQVASMKQEMEETERNLKSQIAVQEKKAHENWIAARAAERKLEDMKQEVTQLRQRLTLLEREQENWVNASRDEIIRPVPKRISGVNDETGNQDLNTSERGMFPPPMMPPPPMMLPPDRPLPPLPPPHMFMPPMERHFRHQPWHLPPPDPGSDFRSTPPEFIPGRDSTPPRRRQFDISDGDTGPHASSPLTTDTRDSRNSTPPHLLPDFHDVPPQPGRPPFYPPPGHPRLPMHPPFRRDMGPGPKRLDNPNEYNTRGPQQPQEQWQHSRV